MIVTAGDKIAAIQSLLDGVPPWADMSAFRALLDDLQQRGRQPSWPADLAERIVDEIGRSSDQQWTTGANLSRAASIIRRHIKAPSPTPAPMLDAAERARALLLELGCCFSGNAKVTAVVAAAITEARAAAIQECALVARSHQTDVSSDFDEGYDSAAADITEAILALATRETEAGERAIEILNRAPYESGEDK